MSQIANEIWLKDHIRSKEQLRAFIEQPNEAIVKKTIAVIDSHISNFLSLSPLFFLATSDDSRRTDVSPRGGTPGFVKVLDEKRLVFPDRPGNRRTDSLLNIVENPQVGMIFVIPGQDEVLRINGRAVITHHEEFISSLGWVGKTTGLAVVVEVEECFVHCPKAFKQAGLWQTEEWLPKEKQPSIAEMYQAHLRLNGFSK